MGIEMDLYLQIDRLLGRQRADGAIKRQYDSHFRLIKSYTLGNTPHPRSYTERVTQGGGGPLRTGPAVDVSPHFQSVQTNFFSGENKLDSPSKRLFKKPFLYASSKERWLVNRHGEFTAQDIVGGTNGWSFTTTKAEEKEWRGVIHHTLNKSKCD